ncbi:MAG: ABC transporter ATP-binding protein [Pigmentiphaga sp.]
MLQAPDAEVLLENIVQRYGSTTVLNQLSLSLERGKVLALLGPSGCGKTTLLKLLAGLNQPTEGQVWIGGRMVAGPRTFVPPEKRELGMVFQDYALWPHMTVLENVAFPLAVRKVERTARKKRAQETLELVGLGHLGDRTPGQLSGGQQQRVALARAVVAKPRLLLFDEPLSNLDRDLRENLCSEIGMLLHELGTTAVYVTHDHEEAFSLADDVAVMRAGRIEQLAAPADLIHRPASVTVAEFLKLGSIQPAKKIDGTWFLPNGVALGAAQVQHSDAASVFVPHSALRLAAGTGLKGRVCSQQWRAGRYHTVVQLLGYDEHARTELVMHTDHALAANDAIDLEIDTDRLRWYPQEAV